MNFLDMYAYVEEKEKTETLVETKETETKETETKESEEIEENENLEMNEEE